MDIFVSPPLDRHSEALSAGGIRRNAATTTCSLAPLQGYRPPQKSSRDPGNRAAWDRGRREGMMEIIQQRDRAIDFKTACEALLVPRSTAYRRKRVRMEGDIPFCITFILYV